MFPYLELNSFLHKNVLGIMEELQTGTELKLNVVEVFTPFLFYFQLKKDWERLDRLDLDMNNFYANFHNLDELRVPPNQIKGGGQGGRDLGRGWPVVQGVGQEYGVCEQGGG